jgi:adenine C2-methylase RlmN of 23S rRNA A2503 and tRNA A37/class 3 adenylate cyclase
MGKKINHNLLVFLYDVKDSVRSTHSATESQQQTFYNLLKGAAETSVKQAPDCSVIKSTGDGHYIVGAEPEKCLLLFLELNHVIREFLFQQKNIEIRCGASFGPISLNDNLSDLSGDTANIVARCCSAANPGELVITETLYSLIRNSSLLNHCNLTVGAISCTPKGCEDVRLFKITPNMKTGDTLPTENQNKQIAIGGCPDKPVSRKTGDTNRLKFAGYCFIGDRGSDGILYAWRFGNHGSYPVESATFNQRVRIDPSAQDRTTSAYTTSVTAGCILGAMQNACRFCHTGKLPFKGHLTPFEIALQNVFMVITDMTCENFEHVRTHAREFAYMGHGESGWSYPQLRQAILVTDIAMKTLRQTVTRHLISTCGVPEMLDCLRDDLKNKTFMSRVSVHFSLHSVSKRSMLMPVDFLYPHEQVIEKLSKIYDVTGEKPSIAIMMFDHYHPLPNKKKSNEYTLTQVEFQNILGRLDPKKHRLNLCVPNISSAVGTDRRISNNASVELLKTAKDSGFDAKLFESFGKAENAACGMLRGRIPEKKKDYDEGGVLIQNYNRAIEVLNDAFNHLP